MLVPIGPSPGARFSCTLCGHCCTTLKERAGAPEWPASFDRLSRLGLYGLRTERGLQVWSWERRRVLAAVASRGAEARFVPSLVALDDAVAGGRVIVLVHELDEDRCPLLDHGPLPDTLVCGAYEARPTVCRSFPVVHRVDASAYSLKCPSALLPEESGRDGFIETYGESYLAAEAGTRVTHDAWRLLGTLEAANVLRLRRGATREETARRIERGPLVDLWDLLDESEAVDGKAWLASVETPLAEGPGTLPIEADGAPAQIA